MSVVSRIYVLLIVYERSYAESSPFRILRYAPIDLFALCRFRNVIIDILYNIAIMLRKKKKQLFITATIQMEYLFLFTCFVYEFL